MLVANFTTVRPTMGDTRTYVDFTKFLGDKPTRLGIVASMYEDNTLTYLTESLKNIVYMSAKSDEKYRKINSMYFEWEVKNAQIKRIAFAAIPTDNGANGSEIDMVFTENYFQKYDIFKIEKTRQQCIVLYRPIRISDAAWKVTVRLIDNDYRSVLDTSGCQIGDTCVFQSVAMPEMHEEGYAKYQSSIERHRGYITTHRVDDSWSAVYAATEDMFVRIATGSDEKDKKESVYQMNSKEKDLLDNFMFVKNSGLLFNKTNVDANGRVTISDPDTNRPIYIGDGAIPQIERFADKYGYNNLTVDVLQTVLSMMNGKSESPTGNHYVFLCNDKFWTDAQKKLLSYLSAFQADGTYLWSKVENDYIKVGATFDSYVFGGNTISFKVDRTYSREYGSNKGFATCFNLTKDKTSGTPAIEMFTLKGGDFITNKFVGVGGYDGLTSGLVSSAVAGSKLIYWGYSGIAVYNPYRSFILFEV